MVAPAPGRSGDLRRRCPVLGERGEDVVGIIITLVRRRSDPGVLDGKPLQRLATPRLRTVRIGDVQPIGDAITHWSVVGRAGQILDDRGAQRVQARTVEEALDRVGLSLLAALRPADAAAALALTLRCVEE
jgi:hypothetical protein